MSFSLKMLLLIMALLNGINFSAEASLYQTAYEPATSFYKSTNSLFASGSASKSELLSQARQSFTEFNFEAQVGKKTVQVENEQILREINVAWKVKVKKINPVYSQNDLSSAPLGQLHPGEIIEIEDLRGAFARFQNSKFKLGFTLTSNLEILDSDPGQWVNIAPLSLKEAPHDNAKQKILVPALSRLVAIKIQNGFGLFKIGRYQGYARISEVLGRVDFAEYGWDQNQKKWEKVLYRDGLHVVVFPNKKLEMTSFRAFRGRKSRALISGDHATLAKGTRTDLIKPQAIRWTQSEIKGHGLIWWRQDLLKENLNAETITTKELLKRKLNGISYDSKTKKGLASAGGIYKTLDGKTWSKITFFGQDDWPVCIHPAGVWFVGSFRSTDEGKKFEPSLKYSEIAQMLQNSGNRNRAFIHLKVLDIEPATKSHVIMKIDTGVTIAKIKAHVLSNLWLLQR